MDRSFLETTATARSGDRVALSALFGESLPRLVAFIGLQAKGALLEQESALDLAQSVCREALQDLDLFEFRGERAFRGWLFLQARRKIASRHRYHRAAKRDVARMHEEGSSDRIPGDLLEPGLSYPEATETMGRSESAVRGLVARGLSRLASELGNG